MNLKTIKLVIWDLDETLWRGTISEGEVFPVPANIEFIKLTTDMGIVHSICSKNDYAVVQKKLAELGLWEYFVFASIDWSSKGSRVRHIIDSMKLRDVNVLFVDDNIQNLEEAKHFCPGIMAATPDALGELYAEAAIAPKTDITHKRLEQYKVLQEKEASKEAFASNEDFLMSCNIRVEIHSDCANQLDRIADLVIRSNQLNYTKLRSSKEELAALFADGSVDSGYVSVRDRFGDYGIVGFYAVKDGRAQHYVFSCRTLGMQVEQYVYMKLGCPVVEVSGEVVSPLRDSFLPPWINQESTDKETQKKQKHSGRVLIKGPCDMSQMYAFLSGCENMTTEFTYTNADGVQTEGHNHTSQLVTALCASDDEKQRILSSTPFFDKAMLDTALLHEKFDIVVLSMLTDGNLGAYRHRDTGFDVALCEKYYDLTDPTNLELYTGGGIFTSGIRFTEENLAQFRDVFDCVTDRTWQTTVANLERIRAFIGKDTTLVLLLGSEQECTKCYKSSYTNRHLEHAAMNRMVKAWAQGKDNVKLICYDRYIHSQGDFLDTINHFVKRVYYDLAGDLALIIDKHNGAVVRVKGRLSLYGAQIIQKLRCVKNKLLSRK